MAESTTTTPTKSPAEYAVLPAGTRVSVGAPGGTLATAKLLQSAMAIGTTGVKGQFMEVSRLIDRDRKYMSDMAEGEDKTFVFLDDVDDTAQQGLLASADNKSTVVIFLEFPNRRVAEINVALSGWAMQSIDSPAGKVLQVEVYAKQNSIKWSATAAAK